MNLLRDIIQWTNAALAACLITLNVYLIANSIPMPDWFAPMSYLLVGAITARLYVRYWKPDDSSDGVAGLVAIVGWWVIWYFVIAGSLMWLVTTLARFVGCCLGGEAAFRKEQYNWEPAWLRDFMQRQLTKHYLRRIRREEAKAWDAEIARRNAEEASNV